MRFYLLNNRIFFSLQFISLLGESICSSYKKTNAHSGVKKLQFSGNPVSEWHEICRLGRVFPNLESLVLAECPLK